MTMQHKKLKLQLPTGENNDRYGIFPSVWPKAEKIDEMKRLSPEKNKYEKAKNAKNGENLLICSKNKMF